MNYSLSKGRTAGTIAVICGILAVGQASAQTNYYFDPSSSGTSNSASGTGVWDTGVTSDWYNGTADTIFPESVPGGVGDTASNPANANFANSGGGVVTLDGTVNPYYLNFNGGAYTVNDGGSGLINFNFPTSTGYYAGGYFGAFLNLYGGSATINTPIVINATANTAQYGFNNGGSGTLTLNGSVTFNTPNGDLLNVFNNGGGKVILNSAFSNSSSQTVTVDVTGNTEYGGSGLSQLVSNGGTTLLDNSGYGGLVATNGGTALTNGAVTINSVGNFSRNGGTFGGATADVSTFTGDFENYDAGTLTFTAAAGGRVNLDGSIVYSGFNSQRVIVSGPGVVVFGSSNGNTYANGYNRVGSSTDVGTEIESGATLLLTNTSGSGTGAGYLVGPSGGTNNVVQLDAGGTLGGSGATQQEVIAQAPAHPGGQTAILAPGDAGQASLGIAPSIATLTLANGLDAESGLTMDFRLDGEGIIAGTNNDLLLVSSLNLSGPVTVNLTALDVLLTGTGNDYTLLVDNDGTPLGDPTFHIVAPTGYALDSSYGDGAGYIYDGGSLSVQLVATPEPSTYGLIGLGLLALVAIGRFRRLSV